MVIISKFDPESSGQMLKTFLTLSQLGAEDNRELGQLLF